MNELEVVQDHTGTLTPPKMITKELYSRYIAYIDAKPKTIETYTRALKQFFYFIFIKGITQPTRQDIMSFRDELRHTHKPTTVQNYITVVRLFFRWTEQEGFYKNVGDHIKGAKLDKEHKKDYLTSQQARAVLESIERDIPQGLRDYAMLVLMMTGGLRAIEIVRANLEDLRTMGDSVVLYVQGKGQEEKTGFAMLILSLRSNLHTCC